MKGWGGTCASHTPSQGEASQWWQSFIAAFPSPLRPPAPHSQNTQPASTTTAHHLPLLHLVKCPQQGSWVVVGGPELQKGVKWGKVSSGHDVGTLRLGSIVKKYMPDLPVLPPPQGP